MEMKTLESYVSKETVLRYLGYKGTGVRKEDHESIDDAFKYILSTASFSKVIGICSLKQEGNEIDLVDTGLERIVSKDLAEFLEGCTQLIVVGVTLGFEVSRTIQRLLHSSPSKAVIMDACASAMTDAFCDQIQDEIVHDYTLAGRFMTQRFSPGYGDLSLESQSVFARFLNLSKRIGVHVTKHHQLIPEKSVIFVMGLSDVPIKFALKTCGSDCQGCKREYCQFRRSDL